MVRSPIPRGGENRLGRRLNNDLFPEDEVKGGVLRLLAEGLAFLRAVNVTQTDTLRVLVVQDFEAVRRSGEQQVSRCIINRICRKDSAARHNTKRVPSRTHTRRHDENSSRAVQLNAS
jgi:hypothetical protein